MYLFIISFIHFIDLFIYHFVYVFIYVFIHLIMYIWSSFGAYSVWQLGYLGSFATPNGLNL